MRNLRTTSTVVLGVPIYAHQRLLFLPVSNNQHKFDVYIALTVRKSFRQDSPLAHIKHKITYSPILPILNTRSPTPHLK